MIFSVRQLGEKAFEHNTKIFFVFVNLKKAYDSVLHDHDGLWLYSSSAIGCPAKLINIIRAFHQNMTTRLRLDGTLLDGIPVGNGLRLGCTMAPVLFNLYMCAVIECWLQRMKAEDGVGIDIAYKYDGELLRKVRQKSSTLHLTECQFADDAALIATTRAGMERAIAEFICKLALR